jgi:hypothetical protein
MKIMVLGHKDHGKTTVANMLHTKFGFAYKDSTQRVLEITQKYIEARPLYPISKSAFLRKYKDNKNSVRDVLKEALTSYTQSNPAKLIKQQYEVCDVYAGLRSSVEYQAAKDIIDFTFWVQDPRKEENDPTMDIVFDPDTMIHINNNGSLLQLECNLKHTLYQLAGIPVHSHDITLRDAIVSNMKHTQTGAHI